MFTHLVDYFKDFPDPRQRGKVLCPLDEVLLRCLLAERKHSLSSHGSARRSSFSYAGSGRFAMNALSPWRYFCNARRREIPALLRLLGRGADRSVGGHDRQSWHDAAPIQKKGAKVPIYMASTFAAREPLVLGRVKVVEKSNEIVAIPALLDMMAIDGAIVTIDAMGCQREIAEKI